MLVSAVSAVSAKASISISAYQQKCGIGPSLLYYPEIHEYFMHANCLWPKFAKFSCHGIFMFYSTSSMWTPHHYWHFSQGPLSFPCIILFINATIMIMVTWHLAQENPISFTTVDTPLLGALFVLPLPGLGRAARLEVHKHDVLDALIDTARRLLCPLRGPLPQLTVKKKFFSWLSECSCFVSLNNWYP